MKVRLVTLNLQGRFKVREREYIHLWDLKKGYIKDINFALSGM